MADAHESLGKASLDLTANIAEFRRNMREGRQSAEGIRGSLDSVAEIARIAEEALHRVKMEPGQGAETRASMEQILEGIHGIKDDAREAARALDHVRLTEAQAAESDLAGDQIKRNLDGIGDQASQADRRLGRLRNRLAEIRLIGAGGGGGNRPGYGVGPFGAGYGRLGLVGTAIGAGALLAPAAGPAAVGLLGAIPTFAFGAAGALGTLVLAFHDVGKAIGGDKKAFDELTPSAQKFVLTVRSLHGWLQSMQETAARSLFPGITTGLRAALTPGTRGVLAQGVGETGFAIGGAATQFGRYIGSPEFQRNLGPLLAAGARGFTLLAGAALELFRAVTIIARAGIPFTLWLERVIQTGGRLFAQWANAQSASGGLSRGFSEARGSLTLVWNLFIALVRVVGALGRALYPVSKVLVKQLTDGLNGLAGMINRNRQVIREIVGGALAAFVSLIKLAIRFLKTIIPLLVGVASAVGGWKHAFQIILSGYLALRLLGVAKSVGLIGKDAKDANALVKLLRGGLLSLGSVEVLTAIAAAAAAYAAFQSVTTKTYPGVKPSGRGKNATSAGSKVYTRDGITYEVFPGSKPGRGVPFTGTAEDGSVYKNGKLVHEGGTKAGSSVNRSAGFGADGDPKKPPKKKPVEPKYGSHAWFMKYLGFDPADAQPGSAFGAVPPFDKNTGSGGKPSAIPFSVTKLLGLASEDASKASALNDQGARAKKLLEAEVGELQKADQILHSKYASATGKARTTLFNEIVRVENKMRSVRKLIGKAIKDDQATQLQLAVDTAKLAVANAQKGTAAYEKAVGAEEKALKAEIGYWDKRAHNSKLAADVRDAALRKEIGYKKELQRLQPKADANNADIEQFLSSFADVVKNFAPNAFPTSGGGKTDTRLYDLVTESKVTNKHLKDIKTQSEFPATGYGLRSAMAVAG